MSTSDDKDYDIRPSQMSRENGEPRMTYNKENSAHRLNMGTPLGSGPSQRTVNPTMGTPVRAEGSVADGQTADTPKRPSGLAADTPRRPHDLQPKAGSAPRPSSTLTTNGASSRQHSARPSPVVRSISTPLTRSLSMRVSKKERRWSERLADPKVPVATTYQDDYQSPDDLSQRLSCLDLEISSTSISTSSHTTYQDSFLWPKDQPGQAVTRSTSGSQAWHIQGKEASSPGQIPAASGSVIRHPARGRGAQQGGHSVQKPAVNCSLMKLPASGAVDSLPTAARPLTKKASLPVTHRLNGVNYATSANRKSSASLKYSARFTSSSEEVIAGDVVQIQAVATDIQSPSGAEMASRWNNRKGLDSLKTQQLSNGITSVRVSSGDSEVSGRKPTDLGRVNQSQLRSSLGVSGFCFSGPDSEARSTQRRARPNHQLQSSGGSPFPYGSDSGSGV